MPSKIKCRWHGCTRGPGGKPALFTPERRTQEFCCGQCRTDRASWRQRRGSVLVDLLIAGEFDKLAEIRAELKKETGQ